MMASYPRRVGGSLLEWGTAGRSADGQTASGDRHVVRPFKDGILVGVVDGLGHGPEAEAAAIAAVRVLEQEPDAPVLWLVRRCHEALLETRGVVMSLASISGTYGTLAWTGVGNVEGIVVRHDPQGQPARESILLRGGVVGYQLPPLYASAIPIVPGDVLVLATDGIRPGFEDHVRVGEEPQRMAERILAECARGTDDALVLVAEFQGASE